MRTDKELQEKLILECTLYANDIVKKGGFPMIVVGATVDGIIMIGAVTTLSPQRIREYLQHAIDTIDQNGYTRKIL